MASSDETVERRTPLTKERVLRRAVEIADADGIEAVTMRRLAEDLGVEAMSLYHHVANKQAVLDGIVEVVFGEVGRATRELPHAVVGQSWKPAVRERILTARTVMLRHPWIPQVIETRTDLGLSAMHHVDGIVGLLRSGGLSHDLIHHALHTLGSRMFGFAQELTEPPESTVEELAVMMHRMRDHVPHLAEMFTTVTHHGGSSLGWCDSQFEFEFALDLILDGIEGLGATGKPTERRAPLDP